MKLLILDQFSEPGGAQQCILDLAPEFAKRGWSATFLAPGNGEIHHALRSLGIETDTLPMRTYANSKKRLRDVLAYPSDIALATLRVKRFIARRRPHIIYANGPRILPAAMMAGIPVVYHIHSLIQKWYARSIIGASLRMTSPAVVAASRFVAAPVERLSPHPVRVIYTGVPDQGFIAPSERNSAPVRIGIIGRIAPEKGQIDFVNAARKVLHLHPRIEFAVYGTAMFSDSDYEAKVRAAAAGLPVTFYGWVKDVSRALHDIDILAVPSSSIEGASRVTVEAFSAGTPVIAYPSGGIPELIQNGTTGLITEAPDPGALAASMLQLIDSTHFRNALAVSGRRAWEERFTVKRYQRDICDFVASVREAHISYAEREHDRALAIRARARNR